MKIPVWIGAPVLVLAAVAALFAVRAGARAEIREVTLVGRGMAFYLPDNPAANPTLTLAPAETVRVVFRNETPGVIHDLTVDGLGLTVGPIEAGQTAAVEFRAPDRPGRYEYYCQPHALMMRGVLEVVAR